VSRRGSSVEARVVAQADGAVLLSGPTRQLLHRSGDTLTLVTPSHTPRVRLGELSTVRAAAAQ